MDYQEKTVTRKDGGSCRIRRPEEADAGRLLRYQRETSGETPYLVITLDEIDWTPEEQAARIKRWNDSPNRLRLLAEADGELAGVAVLYSNNPQKRLCHRCSVDITLYRKFWGVGIGTQLLGELLTAGKAAGYEQAELEVVSTNVPAVGLYRKLGFEAVGTMPRALKYPDGTYADFLLMVKAL